MVSALTYQQSSGQLFDEARDDHFIRDGGSVFAGTHLTIAVVNGTGLDDEPRIQQAFRDCVETCGATLLHIHTHKFSPQGVSGAARADHRWRRWRHGPRSAQA